MRLAILSLIWFVCAIALADTVVLPSPTKTLSKSGRYVFHMEPAQRDDEGRITREAFGVAYEKLENGGALRELWRVEGWYASRIFLSDDGRYLVRMAHRTLGYKPSKDDLAVAFYDRGKLLGQFSTAELVKDHSKVVATTSHYLWLAEDTAGINQDDRKSGKPVPTELDADGKFHLKTCDGIAYTFDITTGKITEAKSE